ncbi:MAG: carbon-nitrogen hydrolase family protein [Thermoplasmatota archaeon]
MVTQNESVKVTVIQASSILFDKRSTVEKAVDLIKKASKNGAKLLLFPEAFIPGYPRGLTFDTVVGERGEKGRKLWKRYYDNSVEIPGETTKMIGEVAKKEDVFIAMGLIEKEPYKKGGTLYCTTLYIGSDGSILGKHRKLKPTGTERLIWGEGDGSTLDVVDTDFGKVGGLICWENYMPLARMSVYDKGVEIYLAPTADSRDTWQATMKHIALEGRCFVLSCNQFITKDMYPDYVKDELTEQPEIMCRGGSVMISPTGEILEGPLYDKEGILYADLDLGEICRSRFDFDVTGHYSRPDIFKLIVNENKKDSVVKEE